MVSIILDYRFDDFQYAYYYIHLGVGSMNALGALILTPILTGICVPTVAYLMGKTGFVEPFDIEVGRFKWEIRPWQIFSRHKVNYPIILLSDAYSANDFSEAISTSSSTVGLATTLLTKVNLGPTDRAQVEDFVDDAAAVRRAA